MKTEAAIPGGVRNSDPVSFEQINPLTSGQSHPEKMTIGFDRIVVRLLNWEVRSVEAFQIESPRGEVDPWTDLLFETPHERVHGKWAQIQGSWWTGFIRRPPRGSGRHFHVTFNASRWLRAVNYPLADGIRLAYAVETLQAELTRIGVVVDVRQAAVKELEFGADLRLGGDAPAVLEVLKACSAPRYFKRCQVHKTGVTWGNDSRSLTAYDKRAELISRRSEVPASVLPPKGTLRLETRLKKPATVVAQLGVRDLDELTRAFGRCRAMHQGLLSELLGGNHA